MRISDEQHIIQNVYDFCKLVMSISSPTEKRCHILPTYSVGDIILISISLLTQIPSYIFWTTQQQQHVPKNI